MARSEPRLRALSGACRGFRWACLLAVVGASAGCTELAPGEDTLAKSENPNLPPVDPVDPRWACLDEPAPAGAVALRPTVDLALMITDTSSQKPPDGLVARACSKLDPLCDLPVANSDVVAVDGAVHLALQPGFEGFVEISSPTSISTLFFLNRALWTDGLELIGVVSPMAFQGLASYAGVTLDPQLGHLLIRTFDCAGSRASDVELSNESGGAPFIFVDGLPLPGRNVTTEEGQGGFINVPTGFVKLQGTTLEGGRLISTATVSVRGNWLTYGDIEPAAAP